MAQAKYTLMIPKADNLGNPLRDIATAAHHYLFYGPAKIEGSYIDPNKRGNWRDDPQEEFDHLVTYAEDTPEMDSTMKQLAVHVCEVANQWGLPVFKEGKDGAQSWLLNNPNFRQGEGADPVAIDQSQQNGILNGVMQDQNYKGQGNEQKWNDALDLAGHPPNAGFG